MKFQFEMSLTEVIVSLVIAMVSIVAAYAYGTYDGFTARDAQVEELRNAYRELSTGKREEKEARARGPAKKAKPSIAGKSSLQEQWIRLQNADKKQKTIMT